MPLFKGTGSEIRRRVMEHVDPLIEAGEQEHRENLKVIDNQYVDNMKALAENRELSKKSSAEAIVGTIVSKK